jgi:hypothetical protein
MVYFVLLSILFLQTPAAEEVHRIRHKLIENTVSINGSKSVGNGVVVRKDKDFLYIATAAHLINPIDTMFVDVEFYNVCPGCSFLLRRPTGDVVYLDKGPADLCIIEVPYIEACHGCFIYPKVFKGDYKDLVGNDIFSYTKRKNKFGVLIYRGYINGENMESDTKVQKDQWVTSQLFDFGFSGSPVYLYNTNELIGIYIAQYDSLCSYKATRKDVWCAIKHAVFIEVSNVLMAIVVGVQYRKGGRIFCTGVDWCPIIPGGP